MIKRCTIEDLDFVNSVLRHDTIYPFIADDMFPPVDEFSLEPLLINPGVYFLTTNKYTVFVAIPIINNFVYEFHVNMIAPEGRGKVAVESTKEAVNYLFFGTHCLKLVSFIPVIYENVVKFACANGEQIEGTIKDAYLKNGKLYDMYLLGVTKEHWIKITST